MLKTSFPKLLIISVILISILACGKITTTYSTIKLGDEDLDKIDKIINSAFKELGHHEDGMLINQKKPYLLWRMNNNKEKEAYVFYVSRRRYNREVTITIEIINLGANQEELKYDLMYLNEITLKIEDMLNAAHIKANIETKSYWVPSMHCI